ncbi:MAG: hypothetical protein LBM96_10880 [Methanobrevibacter sp.]|jgi:hypothetical protein|nr:hypothetical protein [Candidatus Methanoflexus mossambicus]
MRKKYNCEVCGKGNLIIRTRIKNRDSEHFGKSVCTVCAAKNRQHNQSTFHTHHPFNKETSLSDFFQKHIQIIKDNHLYCTECSRKLQGDISEIAHIVKKSTNPEVATNDLNVVYLCGKFSENQCHARFDQNFEMRNSMLNTIKMVLEKYPQFRSEIQNVTNEVLNYDEIGNV